MKNTLAQRKYYYHLDFIRFIFSIYIIYAHILNTHIMPFVTSPVYGELAKHPKEAGASLVHYFFIVGGFFMYRSFQNHPEVTVFEYICDRVVRLWPVLVAAMFLEAFVTSNFDWQRLIINSALLQCTGLSLQHKGVLWYVSSFFLGSIFYYALLKNRTDQKAGFLISLCTYFSLTFLVNYNKGYFNARATVLYVVNQGMVRAVAFIGLGILLCMTYDNLCRMVAHRPLSQRGEKLLFAGKLVVELGSVVFFCRYMTGKIDLRNDLVSIIFICAFLLCTVSDKDPLRKMFSGKIWTVLGNYGYSMYVMQQAGFAILKKTLWLNSEFVSHVKTTMIVSVAFCSILGIGAYYLIERPVIRLYTRWKKNGIPSME